jgi:lactate racemase
MAVFPPIVEYEMIIGKSDLNQSISLVEIKNILTESLLSWNLLNKKVLVIIPDKTRTAPIKLFFELINTILKGYARKVDYLIALGTHPALSQMEIVSLLGFSINEIQNRWPGTQIFNHEWKNQKNLIEIGIINSEQAAGLSEDQLSLDVPVKINKKVLDYDALIICGPVFPHEVVGFSGGNKYFFPGISSTDLIDFTHWLGALFTSEKIIGIKDTPVRNTIDLAANMIPIPRYSICFVVGDGGLHALYTGETEKAWSETADVSAQIHIKYLEKPVNKVLAILPEMYTDLWVGGKGMYKTDPVIQDGGEVIIFAPHIERISFTHGKILEKVGYHVKDFFMNQWENYSHFPWSILAHSTHVKGRGSFENGKEHPRIKITIASRIPPDIIRKVNLNYLNPETIFVHDWLDQQGDDLLVVPHAGEILFRLK